MSGLPGAGKDRWIAENASDIPVVSLDAIRGDLGVKPEDDQGAVAAQAKEVARGYLRQARAFVWNATNTTRVMRRQLIGLLADYHARVRIVYVETAWNELLRRNRARSVPVPEAVLRRLAEKLDVPDSDRGTRGRASGTGVVAESPTALDSHQPGTVLASPCFGYNQLLCRYDGHPVPCPTG